MIFISTNEKFKFLQILLKHFLCINNALLLKIGLKITFNFFFHSEQSFDIIVKLPSANKNRDFHSGSFFLSPFDGIKRHLKATVYSKTSFMDAQSMYWWYFCFVTEERGPIVYVKYVNYHQSLKVCITVLVLQLNKDLNRRKRSL
jgi:hypothetical protein